MLGSLLQCFYVAELFSTELTKSCTKDKRILGYVRNYKPTPPDSLSAPLGVAFYVAVQRQASISKEYKKRLRALTAQFQEELAKYPPELTKHVVVRVRKETFKKVRAKGPLCALMVRQRGRMDGVGCFAAVLLKILIIAYVEAKDDRLAVDLAAWQKAVEQDASTPDIKVKIRGHERKFSGALVSLFRVEPEESQSPFTNLCRPCVDELKKRHEGIAVNLIGKSWDLAKLGRALREKVEFLKKGGRKDG